MRVGRGRRSGAGSTLLADGATHRMLWSTAALMDLVTLLRVACESGTHMTESNSMSTRSLAVRIRPCSCASASGQRQPCARVMQRQRVARRGAGGEARARGRTAKHVPHVEAWPPLQRLEHRVGEHKEELMEQVVQLLE